LHKALAFGAGTAGGAFGALSAAVELPISTCIKRLEKRYGSEAVRQKYEAMEI